MLLAQYNYLTNELWNIKQFGISGKLYITCRVISKFPKGMSNYKVLCLGWIEYIWKQLNLSN